MLQLSGIPGALPLTPERLAGRCPHYHRVPKDMAANIAYRRKVIESCKDPAVASAVYAACSQDLLYFINTFVWTLDPRQPDPEIPMITWDAQDQVLLELVDGVGNHNVWVEKSRDQGVTWDVLMVYLWLFLFRKQQHLLVASRTAELVDDPNEPSSLLPKIDFALSLLPDFMKPKMDRVRMKFVNHDTGSTIKGETTTEDIGRGGRKTSGFVDEFASFGGLAGKVIGAMAAVTNNCIFVSTHKGTGTEFYRNTKNPGSRKVLRVHWTSHPFQTRGMYTSSDGVLNILDGDFRGRVNLEADRFTFPDNYPFILDGKIRSPYYDNACMRLGNDPVRIAQELDVSPEESGENFYPKTTLDKMAALAQQRPVLHRGDVIPDWESGEFIAWSESPDGPLALWVALNGQKMPHHEYVLGVDVATGTGGYMSTNSVIAIGDKWTKEKVGEYVTKTRDPNQLATLAYAISEWLSYEGVPAKIIWEDGGPGKWFKKRLINELRHTNFYKRQNLDKIGTPSSDIPGWWASIPSKLTVHGALKVAMESGAYIEPCPECIEEARHYVHDQNGGVSHSMARASENANESEVNHGDRVLATALMWDQIKGTRAKESKPREIPADSFAGRRRFREERKYQESKL